MNAIATTTATAGALPRQWQGLSFRNKLLLSTSMVSALCIALASLVLAYQAVATYREALNARTLELAESTAANLQAAVAFEDAVTARLLLGNLVAHPHLQRALVYRLDPLDPEAAATEFASFHRSRPAPPAPGFQLRRAARLLPDRLQVIQPIEQSHDVLGYLLIEVGVEEIRRLRDDFVELTLALLLLTVALAWPLSRLAGHRLIRQVVALTEATDSIAQSTNYSVRAAVLSDDELGRLARAFNAMLEELQAHDLARAYVEAEFRRLNEVLEDTVRQRTASLSDALVSLRSTQAQLVEAEKMAALGALVAGVAHEINTPLGICVTVNSGLGDRLKAVQQALHEQRIKRSELDAFLSEHEQALDIIGLNLTRAADLVRSFKQVAADQISEARREFDLCDYLHEVLQSLHPKLKGTPVETTLDCPLGICIDGYPGVLAQIISNLLMNALNHAFAGGAAGRIRIFARRDGDDVRLDFSDDGCGMDESVRAHVFEPFFTTRRDAGGTGLGLHITYNQVYRQLGGTISCDSAPGHGTTFHLRFPVRAPAVPAGAAAI